MLDPLWDGLRALHGFWPALDYPVKLFVVVCATVALYALARGALRYEGSRTRLNDGLVEPDFRDVAYDAIGQKTVLATVIAGVLAMGAILWDVTIVRELINDRSQSIDVDGLDGAARRAGFRIVLVSGDYFWKYGSATTVVNIDDTEVAIAQKLTSNGIASELQRSRGIVAVGLSSCVGAQQEEDSRAYNRAASLIAWLRDIPLQDQRLYLLNLGQYKQGCYEAVRERAQRLVLVIGIQYEDVGVNISEAFKNAIETTKNGILRRLNLANYTHWPPVLELAR